MIETLCPEPWDDYQLIDSGNQEKLERFGPWVLRRPEPQALWSPGLPAGEWEKMARASFLRSGASAESGKWTCKPGVPEKWFCRYRREGGADIRYKISLSSFKHVGLFPEQAVNWDYSFRWLKDRKREGRPLRVLNLFAYTGVASVVACQAGAEVTHLDSVKPVVSWARENMEASALDGIRWIVDDALKFALREERRGSSYDMLIMDPPAYGRGPDGEKWILEERLPGLMKTASQILKPGGCLILNLYSLGFSALIAENLMREHFPDAVPQLAELFLQDSFGKKLPLGITGRFG